MKIDFLVPWNQEPKLSCVGSSSNRRKRSPLLSTLWCAFLLLSIPGAHAENRIQREEGFNGPVNAISEPDSNGTRYVGGDFTAYGRWLTGGGAVVDTTGSGSVNPSFPRVNGTVYTSVPDGSGGFFIGGAFDSVDGILRSNAAHIEADGTLGSWAPEPNGSVRAMVVYDSKVYMGGGFTSVGSAPRSYAAAVHINGTLDETWKPDANGKVYALAVHGTDIYLGGAFTLMNGLSRDHLAAVSSDGVLKTDWTPSADDDVLTIISGTVTTTGLQPNPTFLFVGGDFTEVNGAVRNHAAAIGVDGTLHDWNPNANGRVAALLCAPTLSDCQTIFIGGNFTQVDSQPRARLASWWLFVGLSDFNPNLNGEVLSLASDSGYIYVGGDFTQVGENLRSHGAAFDNDFLDLVDWRPDANDPIASISVESKDKQLVFLGGTFTALRADLRPFAAAVRADGTLSDTWAPQLGGLGGVDACFLSENTIFLGGRFTSINGVIRKGAAALDTTGALQDNFKPVISGGTIQAIVASGDRVYLGGSFTQVDGVSRNLLASLYRINGGVVPDWDAQIEGSRVSALALSDSTLYIGGSFDKVLDAPRLNAAAIETTGQLSPWNPAFSSDVNALVLDGSTVYAGGAFTSVDGLPRNSAAAISLDGSITASWSPMCDSSVKTIRVSSSDIYLGGEFTHVDGGNHPFIAAVGKDGTLRSDWHPSLNQAVSALSVGDSALFVGGLFTKNQEIGSDYLALIDPVTGSNIPIPTPTPIPSPTPTPTATPTPPPTPTFGPQPVLRRPVVRWSPRYITSVVRAFVTRDRGVSYSISATSSGQAQTGRCSIDRRTRKVLCTLDLSKGTWLVSVYPHKQGVTGPPARRRFTFSK